MFVNYIVATAISAILIIHTHCHSFYTLHISLNIVLFAHSFNIMCFMITVNIQFIQQTVVDVVNKTVHINALFSIDLQISHQESTIPITRKDSFRLSDQRRQSHGSQSSPLVRYTGIGYINQISMCINPHTSRLRVGSADLLLHCKMQIFHCFPNK